MTYQTVEGISIYEMINQAAFGDTRSWVRC